MKGRGSEQKPQSYRTTLRYLLANQFRGSSACGLTLHGGERRIDRDRWL